MPRTGKPQKESSEGQTRSRQAAKQSRTEIQFIRAQNTMWVTRSFCLFLLILLSITSTASGQANCHNTGSFEAWLANFKKEALAKGISPSAIAAASPHLVLDQRIINIDRGQKFFAQNFLEISDKMLAGGRLPNGADHLTLRRLRTIAQMKQAVDLRFPLLF